MQAGDEEDEVGFREMAISLASALSLFTPLLIALIATVGTHLAQPDYHRFGAIGGPMVAAGLLLGFPAIIWGIYRRLPEAWTKDRRLQVAFAVAIPVTLFEVGLGAYLWLMATIPFWV